MREIDIDQLTSAIADGAAVVDVREPAEYSAGHVPGAVNIPLAGLTSRLDELDRDTVIYLVCASGHRSATAADVLVALGFDVVNVFGGTRAWFRSGLPVVSGPERGGQR